MEIYQKTIKKIYSEIILFSVIFLFFLQLLSDFIESIYALNLIEVEINENVLAVLFLLTPIVLLFFKKGIPKLIFIIIGEVIIICRVVYPFLAVQPKMIMTGIGVGCFMIFFPVYLNRKSKGNIDKNSFFLGFSFGIALLLSILLKTLGSSVDISTSGWFMWIGWILAVLVGFMLPYSPTYEQENEKDTISSEVNNLPASKWKILGLSFGLMSVFILIYFLFSSPTVIARLVEGNYSLILIILVLVNIAFLMFFASNPLLLMKLHYWVMILLNIIFVVALVLLYLFNSVMFAFIESYPYFQTSIGSWNDLLLMVMIFLSPILIIDIMYLSRELIKSKPSTRKLGGAFFISSGFFLIMLLSAVFTIVWDYIPLIGSIFRDMIWGVLLIVGIFLIVPLFIIKKAPRVFSSLSINFIKEKAKLTLIILALGLTSIIGVIILEYPGVHTTSNENLTLISYNIQQGDDESANKNFEGQFQVLNSLNADVIGLQESDTCRISSGNTDFVRFVSNRLKLYSYYGPKTITGTFGIALLSKFPILNPQTFYMESKGEQTATIWAQILVGSTTFNIFVTHLGNYEDPAEDRSQIVQQENILSVISGLTNIVLMGDFNFEPGTEQYNITVAQLYDCWESAAPSDRVIGDVPNGWLARLPDGRIDHFFVSGELNSSISYITYTGGSAADHPCIYTNLEGPF
jgi:endonuclease/exonuclease/phosphatase family metal-dependent hydrolase